MHKYEIYTVAVGIVYECMLKRINYPCHAAYIYLMEGEEAKEGHQNGETAHYCEDPGCVQVQAVPAKRTYFT